MRITKIYQTLDNRDNADEVENHGPYFCNWSNSWLGGGYYFWDTFIENAHWWGEVHRHNNYIICEAYIDIDDNNCFDLVGNTEHLLALEEAVKFMSSKKLKIKGVVLSRIIEFLQKQGLFEYKAIRAYGINSKSNRYASNHRIYFEANSKQRQQYLSFKPEIQICLLKNSFSALNFRDFKVIYPDYYNEDYAV